jgi:hypothetical protein
MKSYTLLMLLASSNQALRLTRREHDLIQIHSQVNPEVNDIMSFADDKGYISEEKATLYD